MIVVLNATNARGELLAACASSLTSLGSDGTSFATLLGVEPNTAQLLAHLRELAPFADDQAAARALSSVLSAMGRLLEPDERSRLAASLPPELASALCGPTKRRLRDLLFQEVAESAGISYSLAIEQIEVVVQALARQLSPLERLELLRAFPELETAIARGETAPPAVPEPASSTGHSLADGKPGSLRPLSTATAIPTDHRHSVARSDDPHGQTKLSGATGLTQEREGETLADGQAGSRHPISSGR